MLCPHVSLRQIPDVRRASVIQFTRDDDQFFARRRNTLLRRYVGVQKRTLLELEEDADSACNHELQCADLKGTSFTWLILYVSQNSISKAADQSGEIKEARL